MISPKIKKLCLPIRRAYSRIALQKMAVALEFYMLHSVEPKPVHVSNGNPMFVRFGKRIQNVGTINVKLLSSSENRH